MNGLRLWLVTLFAISFLAGAASGLLAADRLRAPQEAPGPFGDYLLLLERTFELDAERRLRARQVLEHYADDIEEVKQRHLLTLSGLMESDLQDLGQRYSDAIRNHVLPADQRDRYDRLSEARLIISPE